MGFDFDGWEVMVVGVVIELMYLGMFCYDRVVDEFDMSCKIFSDNICWINNFVIFVGDY